MDVVRGLGDVLERPRALAIGMFDGVHVGHRAAITRAIDEARARDLRSAVLTFERHPLSIVNPTAAPRLLTTLEERMRLIADLGPDELVLLPFDVDMAAMSAERFCGEVLVAKLGARVVVVGENFSFGAGGTGDAAMLAACGRVHGFETIVLRLMSERGQTISSTRIRGLLASGVIDEVREILGRPPSVAARVQSGAGRGRALGVPTANLEVTADAMRPGRGVYVARAYVDGAWYRAAVNIGRNPTFNGDAPLADITEAFLLGFEGDLYGHLLRLDFLAKIRDERRFADAAALRVAMRRDIDVVARLDDAAFADVGLVPLPSS